MSVTTILEPELLKGCPKDTAPPFTLTFFESNSKILVLASPTTEKIFV